MRRRTALSRLGAAVAAASISPLLGAPARASNWPSKAVTWIYAYPGGGGGDPMARLLAQRLKDRLGQPVLVDNRPGAAGTIGAAAVARAADDHTFLFNVSQELVIAPWLYKSLAYDPARDFAPVCRVATTPLLLVAFPGARIGSVSELVVRAKAAPGRINYASAGSGSLQHLGVELLQRQAGIKLNHIPYKGVAASVTDLIGGQVEIGFIGVSTALAHVNAGKLVSLGLSTASGVEGQPGLRPLADSPLLRGFDLPQWFGLVAPKTAPAAAISRSADEMRAALQDAEVRSALIASGMQPAFQPASEYGRFIAQQREAFGRLIRDAGITI